MTPCAFGLLQMSITVLSPRYTVSMRTSGLPSLSLLRSKILLVIPLVSWARQATVTSRRNRNSGHFADFGFARPDAGRSAEFQSCEGQFKQQERKEDAMKTIYSVTPKLSSRKAQRALLPGPATKLSERRCRNAWVAFTRHCFRLCSLVSGD